MHVINQLKTVHIMSSHCVCVKGLQCKSVSGYIQNKKLLLYMGISKPTEGIFDHDKKDP